MPDSVKCPSCGCLIDPKTGKAIVPVEDRVSELEGRLEQIQMNLESTLAELAEAKRSEPAGGDGDPDPDLDDDDPESRGFGE